MTKISSSKYCTLYIIRHGETDWNLKGLIQGHTDVDLNITGKNQSKVLGEELKDIKFDFAFSSDLQRAKKTAEIIFLERKLAIQTTKLLRERNWGHLEGKPVKNVNAVRKLIRKLSDEDKFTYKHSKEIESYEEIYTRLIRFLREIAIPAYLRKNILVVSHGGVIKSLLIRLGFCKCGDNIHISNTAYVKLLSDGVDFFIKETKGIMKK